MKRVSLNQLMKIKIPSVGLPSPKSSALIPYVKKVDSPRFDMPVPDPLAIAALSIYDAVGCEATLQEYEEHKNLQNKGIIIEHPT